MRALLPAVLGALLAVLGAATPTGVAALSPSVAHIRAEQHALIDQAVARLTPRAPGTANVFFLGFAGYGEQRVFRKEAELARTVFGSRFGSAGRSVELINDVRDRRSYPLATHDNLRYALARLAGRMSREEDVLILLVTSHGSREDGVAITNGRLLDDALSPQDLRQALDAAGIRWRFIVVSACYAGIFIPVLRNDSSLIMTAADSRHTSFGCADDRDLTYFGEALLKDSLPRSCSVESAFASTRRIIRQREADEGERHSNPQLYVGARMRAKLASLRPPRAQACAAQRPADDDEGATR
jgi:hypothetical protein